MYADIHGKGACGTWPSTTGNSHLYNSRAPDDGHNGARNMLQTVSFAIKTNLLHLFGLLLPQFNDDARSKSHQVY